MSDNFNSNTNRIFSISNLRLQSVSEVYYKRDNGQGYDLLISSSRNDLTIGSSRNNLIIDYLRHCRGSL